MKGGWAIVALLALAGCRAPAPHHPMGNTNPQAELARTFSTIRTSTPAQPKTLKILFYGQSISSPKWTDVAVEHLRATYPNTRFIARNMAIPGFESTSLERTAARDVGEFYPDLIVFHVYGDHHAYERIIRTLRSQTAAEIIVQTDHVTRPVEPICPQGLHLTVHAPPGCRGFLWYKQHSWEEFSAGTTEPLMARRYHTAIEPRRWAWNAYLARHGLAISDLLVDDTHPNDAGWALMAKLFDTWFDSIVRRWTPHPQDLVVDRPLATGDSATIDVTGNRIELISDAPLNGKVAAMIDGKPPAAIDGCWQTSRTDMLPNVTYWPALRQVTMPPELHHAGRWSAVVTGLSDDQARFRFAVFDPQGRPDGTGDSRSTFVSPSGLVRIESKDWMIPNGKALSGLGVPEGFRLNWTRRFACGDEPAVAITPGRSETRYVVATGLTNGPHDVTLRLSPEARGAVRAIRVYRPPLTL